jgi:4-hydroxy-tetrahydrodipicolinate synthase
MTALAELSDVHVVHEARSGGLFTRDRVYALTGADLAIAAGEHVRVAVRAGVGGFVATAPFYTRTHPAEIAVHFRAIAACAGGPLYAYDLPISVHTKLGADLLLELAAEGVLAGLKDSSGDESGMREVILGRRDRDVPSFAVLTGSELTVDSALRMGADGVVPGLGNVDPHAYVRLFRAASEGDWTAARAEQERLFRLFGLVKVGGPHMGRGSSALGAFKAALHLRGVIDHPTTALPQIPLSAHETALVGKYLADAGLI